jgi:hypothetical protein
MSIINSPMIGPDRDHSEAASPFVTSLKLSSIVEPPSPQQNGVESAHLAEEKSGLFSNAQQGEATIISLT